MYNPNDELKYLVHGDAIQLSHVPTTRNLHSHTVLTSNYQVSRYGNTTVGDIGGYWQVEVVVDIKRGKGVDRIHSLTTRLRFRSCVLRMRPCRSVKQVEVSCDKENKPHDAHTYWNVESHWNDCRTLFA